MLKALEKQQRNNILATKGRNFSLNLWENTAVIKNESKSHKTKCGTLMCKDRTLNVHKLTTMIIFSQFPPLCDSGKLFSQKNANRKQKVHIENQGGATN